MVKEDIKKLSLPLNKWPFTIIAGPCSAESESQVMKTATQLKEKGVLIYRAGLWKPRTLPSGFEGMGTKAIPWLKRVQDELGMIVMTEVGYPKHIFQLANAGINMFWIGARTTVSPFAVTELAKAFNQLDSPTVFIKNPLNPDINLWKGAILRLLDAGVDKVGAIHRGFSTYGINEMRNPPFWQIALNLQKEFPELTLICDPSHITGKRTMIQAVSQTAIDMHYDGLIIETHCDPDKAWTDAKQQITPQRLLEILDSLQTHDISDSTQGMQLIRNEIDHIDHEIIELLKQRFIHARTLGAYKQKHQISILQPERYQTLLSNRIQIAKSIGIREELITQIFAIIHEESILQQELDLPQD